MELGRSRLDWSVSGQAQVAGSFENGREPSGYIKRWESSWLAEEQVACLRKILLHGVSYFLFKVIVAV